LKCTPENVGFKDGSQICDYCHTRVVGGGFSICPFDVDRKCPGRNDVTQNPQIGDPLFEGVQKDVYLSETNEYV
jgi:hypothetical protein